MSARLPHPSNKKKQDLHHKQIGCMNGLFHFFDCHHFLGGRRISGQNHKRLTQGQNAKHEIEHKNTTDKPRETHQKEITEEKQRVSTESSRASYSSTTSSTFTSAECNTTAQQEPSPLGQSSLLTTPSPISLKRQPYSSLHENYPGTRERVSHVMKHVDSPRPLPMSKLMKPKVSALDGSFRSKDAPRFSYDDRESKNKWKSSVKLKEIPRLSLDSRESCIRKAAYEPKRNVLAADLQRGNGLSSQTLIQEPGSNKRPSSVVAKLMGLEAFPDSTSVDSEQVQKINCCQDKEIDETSTLLSKHNQASRSPRNPQKELSSLQLRNKSSTVKANSRVALEPAPWRHKDGNRASRKPDGNKKEDVLPSVYGEIEKRLTELEFKRSGKDLRALKQILEAMQKGRGKLENNKEVKGSNIENPTSNYSQNYCNLGRNSTLAVQRSQEILSPKSFKSSIVIIKPARVVQKARDSAIFIEGLSSLQSLRTKETENSETSFLDKRSAKGMTTRNNHLKEPSCQPPQPTDKTLNGRTYRCKPSLRAGQHTSSECVSTTMSPRLDQKKHTAENQSRSSVIPTTDSNRTRRYISNHQTEAASPRRNLKPKSPRSKPGVEINRETGVDFPGAETSRKLENNRSSASQKDTEVKSPDSPKDLSGTFHSKDQRNEITATLEQPSPISVLDASFYGEEPPSPVKKISNAVRETGGEILYLDETEWNQEDLDHWVYRGRAYTKADFHQDNLENIKHAGHKLREVNTTYVLPCAYTNADHLYIREIMSTSGFLTNRTSSSMFIELHPSGHLINPNLYLVLEQTKESSEISEDAHRDEKVKQSKYRNKLRRKLIFDMVDEILARELTSAGFTEVWISPNKLGARKITGQKLLNELCLEMDHLLTKPDKSLLDLDHEDALTNIIRGDTMHRKQKWEDYQPEIPGIVLDIERLIFKDLVGEIINVDVDCFQGRPTKHCRQLFSQ